MIKLISPDTLSWIASASPPPPPPSSAPSPNPVGMFPIWLQSTFAVAVLGPEPSTALSSTIAASTVLAAKLASLSEKLTLVPASNPVVSVARSIAPP